MQRIAQGPFTYWPRPRILHNRNKPTTEHTLIAQLTLPLVPVLRL